MRFRSDSNEDTLDINLIPLIDVLLVMLIFLAATTTFARQGVLKVLLPQAQAQATSPAVIEITVSQDGRFAVGQQLIPGADMAALTAALTLAQKGLEDPVVVIHADAMAAHQFVIRAMQAARDAGLGRVQFAAQISP